MAASESGRASPSQDLCLFNVFHDLDACLYVCFVMLMYDMYDHVINVC